MEDFSRAIARCATAQIADAAGFEATQESALDMLSEVMLRYVSEVATASHSYAELAGRTDTNVCDVLLVLEELGMDFDHLREYVQNEPENAFTHPLPKYPIQAKPRQAPTFKEMGEKPPEHIPSFLPAFPDERTYKETPVFSSRKQDKAGLRRKQIKERQQAEQALEKLSQRVTPGAPINYTVADSTRWGQIGSSQVEPDGGVNPFLAPPAWEDPDRDLGAAPKQGEAGPSGLSLGATSQAFSAALQKADKPPSGIKKLKIKSSKADGSSLPIDWPSSMERTAIAMSTYSSEAAALTGFEASEAPKDAAKEKAQKRAHDIIAAGPSAVTMDLDDRQ